MYFIIVPVLLAVLGGCAAGPGEREQEPLTPLRQAQSELPAADVLSINIVVFTADIPTDENLDIERIYTDIREAEGRYLPFHLRRTLEASGQWGDVRVVPDSLPSSELEISGRILESHGGELKLRVHAVDASNRVWLDREYQELADTSVYQSRNQPADDPFQDIYHRIANDLVLERQRLPAAAKMEIQQLATVKFAADLAPQAYADNINMDKQGRLQLVQAPAAEDPLLQRIELAAQRDARMLDVLDQYYQDFYLRMQQPYADWRAASFQELQNLHELQRQARTRKALGIAAIIGGIIGIVAANNNLGSTLSTVAIAGGIYALSSGIDKGRQTGIHVESLRELARSLSFDMQPRNMELRDRTVRLTGSAEHQYREWRQILAEMIAEDDMRAMENQPVTEIPETGSDT